MKKLSWRLGYIWTALLGLLGASQRLDGGTFLYFLLPGFLRPKFGDFYLTKRFFKHFPIGGVEKTESGFVVTCLDLSFEIPTHGFEEGDFFDIIVPYIAEQKRGTPLADGVTKYYANNFGQFFDGPYMHDSHTLSPSAHVVDAGANLGIFSVVASKLVGPSGKVYAFEPITEVAMLLRKNLERNGCTNVVVTEAALGEKEGTITFSLNLGDAFEGSSRYFDRHGDSRDVDLLTLDSFVANTSATIDFIKADIEGAEKDMLDGAKNVLTTMHPALAIRTYHFPDDPKDIEMRVQAVGDYSIFWFRKSTLYAYHAEN